MFNMGRKLAKNISTTANPEKMPPKASFWVRFMKLSSLV